MKNWKSTLVAALTAGIYAALTYFQNGGISLKEAALAAGITTLGFVAKDAGVTGVEK